MNRNTVNKIRFFISGLESRFSENRDIFKKAEVTFVSGLKKYKAVLEFKDGTSFINYKGINTEGEIVDLNALILKEASLYDSLIYTYSERGSIVEITASDKDVRVKNKASQDKEEVTSDEHGSTTSTLLNRKYYINHVNAAPLLKELGILTSDGKIRNDRIRKYNQIDHYIEVLDKDLDRFKGRDIHVVDCGCGKSYLSFVLNYYLTEVRKIRCTFTGIDISENVIRKSEEMAKRLDYRNMNFIVGDIRNMVTERKADIVLSLHACDTATDLAMNFGVRNNADLIVAVPCCHAEMNTKYYYEPFSEILKHNILKRRMADVLTDGFRCLMLESLGYDVTISEYISPLETPKNLMIRARKTGKKNSSAEDEINSLILKLNYAPALYRYINDLD